MGREHASPLSLHLSHALERRLQTHTQRRLQEQFVSLEVEHLTGIEVVAKADNAQVQTLVHLNSHHSCLQV